MAKKKVETNVKAPVEILRGRMQSPIVYVIKFLDEGTDAELAARYRTTGGKISDIINNRNFGYITADAKFLPDQIDKATIFAEDLGDAEKHVKDLLKQLVPGDESDVEALKAARLGARKTRAKKVEEPVEEPVEELAEELD